MVNLRKIMAVFLLLTLVAGLFSGCKAEESKSFQTLEDFKQAKIGVITGSSHDKTVKEILPDAERIYFSSMADMIIAVEQEKIDGYIEDAPFVAPLMWEGMPLRTLEEPVSKTNSGFVFPQSENSKALREEINEFLTEVKADGTADRLIQKWTGDTEPTDVPDYASLSGENGTIRLAISVDNKPILYQQGNSYTGFEMELLTMFGQKMGYAFDIEVVPFESIIAGMAAGKYDMGASSLNITPEREENVDFSIPYASFNVVLVCKGEKKESAGDHAQVDLNNATIGLVTGTSWDIVAQRDYPNAQRMYFGSDADVLMALSQDKVDVFFADNTVYTAIRWENDEYIAVGDPIEYVSGALIFAKTNYDENLLAQVNEYIAKARADGTLDRLAAKWFADEEPAEHPDYTKLTGENGTLRIAVGNASKPLSYQKGSMYSGYEVEFLTLFAEAYGYKLDLQGMTFDALIPTVSSGKCDMGACGINITPERAETVTFSDSHIEAYGVVVVCAEPAAQSGEMTLADLNTGTIGVVTGTSWDQVAQRQFPNAERKYFVSSADALLALEQGKIDAFFADKTVYAGIRWENSAIDYIDEPLESVINALIFGKEDYDENLLAQVNAFIAKAKENGTLERLEAKWFADAEPAEHPDYTKLTGKNGTIRVAVSDAHRPVAYQKGTMYTGYEVDFLTLFAEEYGYQLDFQGMAFDALIPTVASGKCDIGACGITITPERAENVTFSDPHIETYGVAVISAENAEQSRALPLTDFENAKIGVHTGTVFDDYAKERFPNASRIYFNQISDMIVAVEQGKIDGYISESTYVTAAIWEGAEIEALPETLDHTHAGYIFPKGEQSAQLRQQLDAFIREAKENGTVDTLMKKWTGKTEPTETPDYKSLTGENGTIKVAVAPDLKPVTYIKDGEPTGYEIEILTMFAKEYGYKLDFAYMTFDAILPGVTTGKYDIGTGAVTITEERAESVDFSESHLTVDVVMVVSEKAEETEAKTGFWSDVKESFEKTFIREDRWKLILEGIGVTMLISVSAAVLGTLLGFGLYMLSRSDVKLIQALTKGVAKVYSRIIAGTPVVVILMILFYVIFGKIRDMSGVVVAIIGFTLTFGAFVYDHMTVSVGSVDPGQTEAAYALGYTKNQTFFRIIFPQAMSIFLPSYCGQAVELIKATAVVGYIAVNDLTKMGDIIRSNTYEAFFPLIATAVIYFLLTWMLSALLGLVKRRFEPKRRSKEDILKGVKTV